MLRESLLDTRTSTKLYSLFGCILGLFLVAVFFIFLPYYEQDLLRARRNSLADSIDMADWFFTINGVRKDVEIELVTPLTGAFTKPVAASILGKVCEEKNIKITPNFEIAAVNAGDKTIESVKGETVDYDLLISIPPNFGAQVMRPARASPPRAPGNGCSCWGRPCAPSATPPSPPACCKPWPRRDAWAGCTPSSTSFPGRCPCRRWRRCSPPCPAACS